MGGRLAGSSLWMELRLWQQSGTLKKFKLNPSFCRSLPALNQNHEPRARDRDIFRFSILPHMYACLGVISRHLLTHFFLAGGKGEGTRICRTLQVSLPPSLPSLVPGPRADRTDSVLSWISFSFLPSSSET